MRCFVAIDLAPEVRAAVAAAQAGLRAAAPRADVRWADLAQLGNAIAAGAHADFGAWTAQEVVLYRSHLKPSGAVYEPLARLPFAG